jgi:cell division ATPase FtsA
LVYVLAAIANMDLAESAIGAAVQTAEQLAGETVRKVYVNLSVWAAGLIAYFGAGGGR